jgi:hypothetical protein
MLDDRYEVRRLIDEAAEGTRRLSNDELMQIVWHIGGAGFDPYAREQVRGSLAGTRWRGKVLRGRDRLPPLERHYLRHVVQQQWPEHTSLQGYAASIRDVIRDPTSGVFTSRYQGAWQVGVVRLSRSLRGPGGSEWILIEYRTKTGHWVTAYQPAAGLAELQNPRRENVRWLRQPRLTDELR